MSAVLHDFTKPGKLTADWRAAPTGVAVDFPHREILLRWTSAIKAKAEKLIGSADGKTKGYLALPAAAPRKSRQSVRSLGRPGGQKAPFATFRGGGFKTRLSTLFSPERRPLEVARARSRALAAPSALVHTRAAA